ncbi:MAG: MBL fold metallo-hydrolase [Lentisphaeria bacterium]|nr:MBL fold metallo-hydrolase [Lentisphaeria bacterium]
MNLIIEKLKKTILNENEIVICRLGQHSFLLKIADKLIAFDPYLSENKLRLIPPLISANDLAEFDLIFGSHDHSDHIDRSKLAEMSSGKAKFVFPRAIVKSLVELPPDKIIGMNDGEKIEIDGVSIWAVAAAHEFLDMGENGLYPYLGFVVSCGNVRVYHSGDCCIYDGLLRKLKNLSVDIMLLPINGRDAVRLKNNCIGNMTYQEAADLAGWSSCKWVIPAHYDMFANNSIDPQLFVDYVNVKYPQLKTQILRPGEVVII